MATTCAPPPTQLNHLINNALFQHTNKRLGTTDLSKYRDAEVDPVVERDVQNELEYFLTELDMSQGGMTQLDTEYLLNQQDLERYQDWMNTTRDPHVPDGIQEDGHRSMEELDRTYSDWYLSLVLSSENPFLNQWWKGPPFLCHYTQVKNPAHLLAQAGIWPTATQHELSAVTCGRGGDHLRRITMETGVTYIWANREKGCFEIWGPRYQLRLAKEALHLHMIHEIGNRFVSDQFRDHETLATEYARAVLGTDNFSEWQDQNWA